MQVQRVNEPPEVKRRRLRAALRHAREEAKLTQKDVVKALDWSVSKIIRIEQGAVGVTPTDLRALLAEYGVTNEKQVSELVELARGSRRQSFSEYRDVFSKASLTLFGNEAAAKVIYKYEPTFVPGLLQTEEYARALLTGLRVSEDKIERTVAGRLARQELLDEETRPELQFILGEAVVRRQVGGQGIMLHQLEQLKALAGRTKISLQVLPFAKGAHPRMGGAFTIMEFADDSVDDLLYLENAGGASISRNDPELIAEYLQDFDTLQEMAIPSSDFADFIDSITQSQDAYSPARGVKENGSASVSLAVMGYVATLQEKGGIAHDYAGRPPLSLRARRAPFPLARREPLSRPFSFS